MSYVSAISGNFITWNLLILKCFMNVFYEPFDTKLVMLSNIMQYLKNGLFSKCFHKVFVKNMMKKLSHLNTKFQDSFQHVCIIAPSCVLYLKFYVFFCFCHYSLFNVLLLYLFIMFSQGICQKHGEKGVTS